MPLPSLPLRTVAAVAFEPPHELLHRRPQTRLGRRALRARTVQELLEGAVLRGRRAAGGEQRDDQEGCDVHPRGF